MAEELESIDVQAEGGDPIKDFYEAISSEKYFKDEADFRKTLSDPKLAKDFYNAISSEGYFKDYSDFETSLGLKKKIYRAMLCVLQKVLVKAWQMVRHLSPNPSQHHN